MDRAKSGFENRVDPMNTTDLVSLNDIGSPTLVSVDPSLTHLGPAAAYAWHEFFSGMLPNRHTRASYMHAIRRFLSWTIERGVPFEQIQPGTVGTYFDKHPGSAPTKKLHLAALRRFFDVCVQRHVLILNPAATVKTERYQAVEGATPEISDTQARALLASIDGDRPADRRDAALIGTLIYTAARAGAVAQLRLKDFVWDGSQYSFRFSEKNGKARSIPVRHDLQLLILRYLETFNWKDQPKDAALFRTIAGRSGLLTNNQVSSLDVWRVVKRRLSNADLPTHLSPHSFRVCTVTDLLKQGVSLEDVQQLAGHADPRTTRLYDRRQRSVTRNLVERISI